MIDRETVVVFGVLSGLVIATTLPFALPALRLDAGGAPSTPTPSPAQGKSEPAAFSDGPAVQVPGAPATQTRDNSAQPASGSPNSAEPDRQTPAEPEIQCAGRPSDGTPSSFPLTVGGHEITGENVTVAVIDPSGFDVDDPRISGDVAATDSFWSGGSLTVANEGANRHGTESAAVVSQIAPDAELYLANFAKANDFTRAVDWAVEQDVDLIVAPVAFYAKPNDGTAPVSRAVTKVTDQGIPVVVPVGNVATNHWEGNYSDGPWLEFEPNDTRMYLRGSDRPAQIWLWWNRTEDTGRNDFRITLYREDGDESERIATSEDYPKGPVGTNQVLFESIRTNNLLSKSIANGTYYIRISGPPDAAHRVELVAAAHRLETPVERGSLMAPATAPGDVIAVGAAPESTGRPLETSSRGPTNDGRPGIDLLSPGRITGSNGATFTGTSAAAAYTGGVVALLSEVDPTLTPGQAEAILQATAGPAESERDLATGYGLIDPADALRCLADSRTSMTTEPGS